MIFPTLFFLKIAMAIRDLFRPHINFWNIYSNSLKNAIGVFIRIAVNLQIALGGMAMLTMLILPTHKRHRGFQLFVSSSILFIISCCHIPFSWPFLSEQLLQSLHTCRNITPLHHESQPFLKISSSGWAADWHPWTPGHSTRKAERTRNSEEKASN